MYWLWDILEFLIVFDIDLLVKSGSSDITIQITAGDKMNQMDLHAMDQK